MEPEESTFANPPFFSVVVASYNRAKLLPRALNSLLLQVEADWEAVIIDDGSTDETPAVVSAFLEADTRFRYLKQDHEGEASAKNRGIVAASGRFITFLDSDDEYDPLHLASRKNLLIRDHPVGFLYGGVRIIGNQYVPDRFHPDRKIPLTDCVIGGTFFIDRPLAVSLHGFRDILLGSDSDFFDRVTGTGCTMVNVCEPTYIYHHETGDSVTNRLMAGM